MFIISVTKMSCVDFCVFHENNSYIFKCFAVHSIAVWLSYLNFSPILTNHILFLVDQTLPEWRQNLFLVFRFPSLTKVYKCRLPCTYLVVLCYLHIIYTTPITTVTNRLCGEKN